MKIQNKLWADQLSEQEMLLRLKASQVALQIIQWLMLAVVVVLWGMSWQPGREVFAEYALIAGIPMLIAVAAELGATLYYEKKLL